MTTSAPVPVLAARGLVAFLPGENGPVAVLDRTSLELSAGEIVDVTGPSGAGKTTLLRALARLLPGARGELAIEGTPAEQIAPQQWRCKVVLLPQKPAIVAGSVRDNLLLPWALKARAAEHRPADPELRDALERVALADVGLDRDSSRLSVGQQARVALLRVLLTEPPVLLLDEPDAALDDATADSLRLVLARFAESGGAVVRVRHRSDDLLARRRLRLSAGVLEEVPR